MIDRRGTLIPTSNLLSICKCNNTSTTYSSTFTLITPSSSYQYATKAHNIPYIQTNSLKKQNKGKDKLMCIIYMPMSLSRTEKENKQTMPVSILLIQQEEKTTELYIIYKKNACIC